MPSLEDPIEEKGDPSEWVDLTHEQTRCLLGLKKYYITFLSDEYDETSATREAWEDLKREFEELKSHKWFKVSTNDC